MMLHVLMVYDSMAVCVPADGLVTDVKPVSVFPYLGSEIWWESKNPFSQRFSSTKSSKWILINILVYHIKLYDKNP